MLVTESGERPLIDHLIELRSRLLRALVVVLAIFVVLIPFADPLYTTLAKPLLAQLPENSQMIAIDVASPLLAPFKLVLMLAVALAVPVITWQLWAFVSPGLKQRERRFAAPLVISTTALFYVGCLFAYFVVFPLIFAFFTATAPEGVQVMTDISRYLDFVIVVMMAFGVVFETPVAVVLLVLSGLVRVEQLTRARPYVVVAAFAVGMILTPPDVIMQTLLAVPMYLLYELGIGLARLVTRRRR